MEYFYLLKQRRLAALWLSQVLSAIGDQLYLIAAMWLSVHWFGSRAAFVVAAIAIARICFGLIGGVCADRNSCPAIMVIADLARFAAVLTLPVFAAQGPVNIWHLVLVSAVIGMFGAFFEPALLKTLPALVETSAILPMNGLIDITQRIARAVGPVLAGSLIAFMPIQHFFTLDAVSFLISAAAIASIGSHIGWHVSKGKNIREQHIFSDLRNGMQLVFAHRSICWILVSESLKDMLWSCAFTVGVPIWVSQLPHGSVTEYGLIAGAYGAGNVVSNIFISHMRLRRKRLFISLGYGVLGIGFVVLALIPNLAAAMFGAAFAAIGGPMCVLPTITVLQTELPSVHLGKIFSFRMILSSTGWALGLLIAAPLYAHFGTAQVIFSCALFLVFLAIAGFFLFGVDAKEEETNC